MASWLRKIAPRFLVVLTVAALLPTATALGHGGETGPGHHDDEAPAKSEPAGSGKAERPRGSGKSDKAPAKAGNANEQVPPGSPAGGSGGSGGDGNPVPHFIALAALAAIGAGVIVFRRTRNGHPAEPGQPTP